MKNWIRYACLLFIISDAIYSYIQHYQMPIDGDVPSHVIPTEPIKTVLEHPLGLYAIISNTHYHNPNRFFSHWTMYKYLTQMPKLLSHWFLPIYSSYYSCGLFKICIQLLLLILFSIITTNKKPWSNQGILSMAIMTPFFQTHGYNEVMALIDPSITYVFFFAFPICLLLIFFMPFISKFYWEKECPDSIFWLISMIFLAVIVNLSGAINYAVCLVAVASIFIYFFINHKKIVIVELPWRLSILILVISSMALYSMYLNQFNTMNSGTIPNLIERYHRLPKGLYDILTSKFGFSLLLIINAIQYYLLKFSQDTEIAWRLREFFKYILIFTTLYILLLPLGGFREYRFYLIRYDIIMPITILLILFYGMVSLVLLKHIESRFKKGYITWIISIMLFYTLVDSPDSEEYQCQLNSIETLVSSPQDTVLLTKNCNIYTWSTCDKPQLSQDPITLLQKWNILKQNKLFYQK